MKMTQRDGKIYHVFGLEVYSQNDHTNQGNLQIQCNPYEIINGIFDRTRVNNIKICMETQKTPK